MSSSHLAREVATQPADWARAAERAHNLRDVLPREGERVATIGCGTSWFMGQAYASLREDAGQGVTDAWSASDHRLARGYDAMAELVRSHRLCIPRARRAGLDPDAPRHLTRSIVLV